MSSILSDSENESVNLSATNIVTLYLLEQIQFIMSGSLFRFKRNVSLEILRYSSVRAKQSPAAYCFELVRYNTIIYEINSIFMRPFFVFKLTIFSFYMFILRTICSNKKVIKRTRLITVCCYSLHCK